MTFSFVVPIGLDQGFTQSASNMMMLAAGINDLLPPLPATVLHAASLPAIPALAPDLLRFFQPGMP